jgi:hypothetical protein
MTDSRTERGTCRFFAEKGEGGKPRIRVQLFHASVPLLNHAELSFNLLSGLSLEQAHKFVQDLNEYVLDLSVTLSSSHPLFEAQAKASPGKSGSSPVRETI